MQSEGNSPNFVGISADFVFETRREAAAREAAATRRLHEEAEAKGELWTVQAALYPGRCTCLVYLGRVETTEDLSSQCPEAYAIFGPVYLTGKQPSAMAEALALFCVDEITIRVVR